MICKLCQEDFGLEKNKLSAKYCPKCRYSKERYDLELHRKGARPNAVRKRQEFVQERG